MRDVDAADLLHLPDQIYKAFGLRSLQVQSKIVISCPRNDHKLLLNGSRDKIQDSVNGKYPDYYREVKAFYAWPVDTPLPKLTCLTLVLHGHLKLIHQLIQNLRHSFLGAGQMQLKYL